MSKKLNMAIAGVGRVGITHLIALSQANNVQLMAIVEPVEEVGRKYAEQFHVDYYKSISELAARDDIQAVDICVPEEHHLVAAVEAAQAGKHIMIEKPLAKTTAECEQIIAVCKEHNVRLMVAHTCRSLPAYRKIRNECQEGRIGELCQVSIRRYAMRNAMDFLKGRVTIGYYIAIHDLDAVMWMTGRRITQVYALKIDKLGAYGEDGMDIAMRFDNGASGTMNISWFLPSGFPGDVCEIDLLGTQGVVRMRPYENGLNEYSDKAVSVSLVANTIDGRMMGGFMDQLEHFADAVMQGTEFRSPAEDVSYSVKVIEAILRSVESGQPEEV